MSDRSDRADRFIWKSGDIVVTGPPVTVTEQDETPGEGTCGPHASGDAKSGVTPSEAASLAAPHESKA